MRWRIIKTLLHKELLRHLSNRGGLALAALLLGMALLMRAFGGGDSLQSTFGQLRGVRHCYVDYWEDGPWIEFLRNNVPDSLKNRIHFRNVVKEVQGPPDQLLTYPSGTGAIQIRPPVRPGDPTRIWCWHPGESRSVISPFENWFWHTTRRYYCQQILSEFEHVDPGQRDQYSLPPLEQNDAWVWRELQDRFAEKMNELKAKLPPERAAHISIPSFSVEYSALSNQANTLAAALVLFALFFVCVYTLPSLTCEEREHGVLLA